MLKIKRSELEKLAKKKLGDDSLESQNKILVMISTALAARTSYTVVGDEKEVNYSKMIDLHDRLIKMRHDSPLEHCARAMSDDEYIQYQKTYPRIINGKPSSFFTESINGWCRNFKGFIQYRHLIENN